MAMSARVAPRPQTPRGTKKTRPVGRAEECFRSESESQEKPGRSYASGLSPISVVTRLMISVASATICFGS